MALGLERISEGHNQDTVLADKPDEGHKTDPSMDIEIGHSWVEENQDPA